jgi:ribosomal-protein-alanine N-acetyltransferase
VTAAEVVFLLRPYRPSDLKRLCQIDRSCFPPQIAFGKREMQQALEGTGTLATVAETDSGEIAGFVAAERTSPRKGHIVTIDVRRQCRGEGLGTQLMLRVEDQLLRLGASTIELETGRENSAAQSLFKNLGYERLAIIDDYYPDGGGAWIMRKRIARPPANRPCVAG